LLERGQTFLQTHFPLPAMAERTLPGQGSG